MLRLSLQVFLLLSLVLATIMVGRHALTLMSEPVSPVVDAGEWKPERSDGVTPTRQNAQTLGSYPTTLARPIFFEGRTLPKPAPIPVKLPPAQPVERKQAPAPAAPARMDLKLLGVILQGDTRRALLGAPALLPNWYSVGEKINGWTLSEITSDGVILTANGREEVVNMYRRKESN